jgi:hypothetical protein
MLTYKAVGVLPTALSISHPVHKKSGTFNIGAAFIYQMVKFLAMPKQVLENSLSQTG